MLAEELSTLKQQIEQLAHPSNGCLDEALYGCVQERLQQIEDQVTAIEAELQHLQDLAAMGRVVNSSLELEDVLRIVMDTLVQVTGAERGFLMLRDERGSLDICVARNWERESIEPSDFAISRTVVERVINEGKPILTTNAQEDPRFGGQESIVAYNLRSILCVPLLVKGQLIGVLYADNRIHSGIFTGTDRDLLSGFANQAAVAIENARLFASVRSVLAEVTRLKDLMTNAFASIASGVFTVDETGRIVWANRAAGEILGWSDAGFREVNLVDVLPELMQSVRRVAQTGTAVTGMDLKLKPLDLEEREIQCSLTPLKNAAARGVVVVVEDLTEKKRLEAQSRLFEKMVSPGIIEQLDPDSLELGGKRACITVLFADIRGFTGFSEAISPEQLVAVLNRHLAAAVDAVLAQQGTIDKFMGDALLAWFNAPVSQSDHTLRAVRAALGIREAIRKLHADLPAQHRLEFRVGIHTGEAILGLVGSQKRMEYTAIGDSVNTARRIQENAARGQILVSAATVTGLQEKVRLRPMNLLTLKGKKYPIRVWEVIGMKMA